MRRRTFLATAASGLLGGLGCAQSDPTAPEGEPDEPVRGPLALTGGRLIDGTGAPPSTGVTVVMQGDRITATGPDATVAIPAEAEILDLGGATILPGFINAHVHQAYDAETLAAWARQGVTTVRDLGANPAWSLFKLRDALRLRPSCARIVAAGPMITVPGGYPGVPWSSSIGLAVSSVDDARAQVSRLLDEGADIIKIAVESGGSFDRRIPTLSPGQIAAIVETAHARATRVSAHILTAVDLERALDGGADDIAHMTFDSLPERLIERMVAKRVFFVPTLELWHGVGRKLGQAAIANLRAFVQAGGRVALGTDYAGYSSTFDLGMPVREIDWMRAAGMSPMEIIVAATQQAAEVCNLGGRIGVLAPGRIADVLVVDGDPLQDLAALGRPLIVVREGAIIRR